MIMHGDCLDVMASMDAGSVDLIYADPPFNSGRDYKAASGSFGDKFASTAAYVEFIQERLVAMKRILSPTGSVYVHVDDTACHRVRCAMDDVFGEHAFRTQVIWQRSVPKNNATKSFGRVYDVIMQFGNNSIHNAQFGETSIEYINKAYRYEDGRGKYLSRSLVSVTQNGYKYEFEGYPFPAKGWLVPLEKMKKYAEQNRLIYPKNKNGRIRVKSYFCESKGKSIGNLWTDIPPNQNPEYPTQKPIKLLERIISASSNVGDLVFDPFMGSGTTLVAAKRLNRRYAGCDISQDAIDVANKRLETENERLL